MSEGLTFFDRDGNPMPVADWLERYGDIDDRIVVNTLIGGERSICTLWNGCTDGQGNIQLFATHYAERGVLVELLRGYDDEAAAVDGHGWYVAIVGGRFFCPACRHASSNIEDLRHGYCGMCKGQTAPPWAQRQGPA